MGSNVTTAWFDYPQNFSNGTETVDSLGSFFKYVHFSTNGVFSAIVLLLTFAISFTILKSQSFEKALAASSFITLLISILFFRLGMLQLPILIGIVMLTVISIILVRNESGSTGRL